MKMIVGLGNPGNKYNFTRHNAGFLVLDYYLVRQGLGWEKKPKLGAVWAREGDVIFVKPQDFYNLSGLAVRAFARYYKIEASDILVVCDNFDLEFGKMRLRASGVAGGNNGLKSIDKELGTSTYAKLRIGTRNDETRQKLGDVDFVLSRFTAEEKKRLPEVLEEAHEKIEGWIEAR